MESNTPKKRGPKPKPITPEAVRVLSAMQLTQEEIGSVFSLSRRQFIARMEQEEALREALDQGWAQGRGSLRRKQYELAMDGNPTMLIWLGKQYLNQKDHVVSSIVAVQDNESTESPRERVLRKLAEETTPPDAGASAQ